MSKVKIARQTAERLVNDTKLEAARSGNDTIRLWENFKDQALMWRSIALLQIPATSIAVMFAAFMWATRETILQVPAKPLPGVYAAYDIPDTEFVNVATEYTNLIATYQPMIARKQYESASRMLIEPLLTKFKEEMMKSELEAIENTSRTQVFFIDPTKTVVARAVNEVRVSLVGERMKIIAGQELPAVTSRFSITMTTVPRNALNPYGIVIKNVEFKPNVRGERPDEDQW
jgi:hypothetical protein